VITFHFVYVALTNFYIQRTHFLVEIEFDTFTLCPNHMHSHVMLFISVYCVMTYRLPAVEHNVSLLNASQTHIYWRKII